MSERRGMLIAELPSPQFPEPDAFVDTRFTTQVLVAALFVFGIGSGGPKRHPGFPGYSGLFTPSAVQLRCLPLSVAGVPGTEVVVVGGGAPGHEPGAGALPAMKRPGSSRLTKPSPKLAQ